MHFITSREFAILLKIVAWATVATSPIDKFLSVRRQRCGLIDDSITPPEDEEDFKSINLTEYGVPPEKIHNLTLEIRRSGVANIARQMPPLPPGFQEKMKKKFLKRQRELSHNAGPQHVGPEVSDKYDPSVGYEPYWVGGQWVIQSSWKVVPTLEPETDEESTVDDSYCGYICSPIYKDFGTICGIDGNFTKYTTFYNYCTMLATDCDHKIGMRMAHKGSCGITLEAYRWGDVHSQHKFHSSVVDDFYSKYGMLIGSGISTTVQFNFTQFYRDDKK